MVWTHFPTLLGAAPSRKVQWDPWQEMGRLQDEVTRFLGGRQHEAPSNASTFPPVRIVTDADGARLTALVPGLGAGDVEIVIERDLVKLEGTRNLPEARDGENAVRRERRHGAFSRSFRLPFEVDADAAQARVLNGVLELTLPRTPEQRPKKIEVRAS